MTGAAITDNHTTVTTRKLADRWGQLLMLDPTLTAGAKLTGQALKAHLNYKTLEINPSVDRLAVVTVQTSRAVEKHLKALHAAGLLMWGKKGFRTSNRYSLLIPNARRELMDRNTELWAGIANPEPEAGTEVPQPRTVGGLTPNRRVRNPEPSAGGTPENPLNNPWKTDRRAASLAPKAAPPRAPDDGELAPVCEEVGEERFCVWLGTAVVEPKVCGTARIITVPKQLNATYITSNAKGVDIRAALDRSFPEGWTIRSAERGLAAA